MKKLSLLIFLFPTIILAQRTTFDLKASYARIGYETIGSGNGYQFGTGFYYSVYDDEDSFFKDLSLGAGVDYSTALANGVWYYNVLAGPEFRAQMPYSYFKFGLGYNYWKVKGLSSIGAVGIKFSFGGLIDISEDMKAGLDISIAYKVTKGKVSVFSIGPMLSMGL